MAMLAGKIALITGASRGIGKAIAQRFAAEGASLVVSASRLGPHGKLEGSLQQTVEEIQAAGGKAKAITCNLTDPQARADLVRHAAECFGPVDILVNNAAGSRWGMPSEITAADRNWMYDLNLNAPIDLAQQAIPAMRERGQGWILNISSASSLQPVPPYRDTREAALAIAAYGATKAALNRYTEGLAHELATDGIYVNSLAPESIVLTPGARFVIDIARRNPDMVEPVEMMAEAALALCSGSLVGQVAYSRQLLHTLGLKLHSLDGKTVIGDAFPKVDLDL